MSDTDFDLLGELENDLGEVTTEETKTSDRLELTSDQQLLERFVGLDAVFKLVKEAQGQASDAFKSSSWERYTDMWFAEKSMPGNPKVEIKKDGKVDHAGIFQVKSAWKVQHMEGVASARAAVTGALESAGFEPELASKIFDENIDIKTETQMRPLDELARGRYVSGKGGKQFVEATAEEKVAAQKILKFLKGDGTDPLTKAEIALIMKKSTSYVVKSGFTGRAHGYCKNADELRALLAVIKPQLAISGVKFAKTSSQEDRLRQMVDVFKSLVNSL